MEYPQENAYVFLDVASPKAKFAQADPLLMTQLFLGLCNSETGYTISPEQQLRSSHGQEHVLSWKLELNLQVLAFGAQFNGPTTEAEALHGPGLLANVVFVPADQFDLDLENPPVLIDEIPDASVLSGMEVTQLAPMRIYLETSKQYGRAEVQPVTLSGSAIARHKNQLHRVHPLETLP